MRLTDFFGGFGGNLQEPLVFKFEESSEWVAPANGTVSITAAGGGGYGGSSLAGTSGGDTKITAFGGTLTLGGGVAGPSIPSSGGQPSADSNWRFGLGNCYSGLVGMASPNHPLQINAESSDGSGVRSYYGGGGVRGASSFFGGSGTQGGVYYPGPGAAICVNLIFNVSAGDSILMEIGARAATSGGAPIPGSGVCIITFYGD